LEIVMEIKNLEKIYMIKGNRKSGDHKQKLHAVDKVSLEIYKGETFGVVGESGSGKSTLSRLLMGLIEPTSGEIFYKGEKINDFDSKKKKAYHQKVQMVFQDPYSSLNPRMKIFDIVAEPLIVHKLARDRKELIQKVKEALETVDLPSNDDFLYKLPEEISGGQRQRVGITRSLISGAEFIIADEPVSMLDTTIKAKIVSLLEDLKTRLGLTYIFITHEIGIAYHICDRIGVMYLGGIMELGTAEEIIKTPLHPYTKLLMDAVPPLTPDENWGESIVGKHDAVSVHTSVGCRFCPRCKYAKDICKTEEPKLIEVGKNHFVNCHLYP
jgi:oligopeptide/dipeptide ABC transporter ATP-binding protein